MTLKKMFQKIEAYNEIAEMMCERKAAIKFVDIADCGIRLDGARFDNYASFRKHIRSTYIDEAAEQILKSADWELDQEWTCIACEEKQTYAAELVAD